MNKPKGWTGHGYQHGLARKGVRTKTAQVVRPMKASGEEEFVNEYDDHFTDDFVMEFQKEFGEITEVTFLGGGGYTVRVGERKEFLVFDDWNDGERYAIDQVREDLEESPEGFTKSWLMHHVYVSDTDKRIIAGEEADASLEARDDEEILSRADMEDDWQELEDQRIEFEDKLADASEDRHMRLKKKIEQLEKEQSELVDEAREKLHDEIYEEWYEGLDSDPIGFLVEDQGIYTEDDAYEQRFIQINVTEASEDAVRIDGVAHFLARYDGEENEVEGKIVYRTD